MSERETEAPSSAAPSKKKRSDAPAAITMRGVSKSFGAVKAVNDVTLRVPEGSVFGLIGPNGAGKTTTFSMLAGYLRPTSGEILVLDHAPATTDALKGKLGVLPQDALLPANEKVGEFLVYLARLQGLSAGDAVDDAHKVLAEVEGSGWWDTKCGTLSHGMAKRVGIAQAFLGKPRVVLLDEPTAGLDPKVAHQVREVIKRRQGQATLVVSSHNLRELEEICDHAAILDRGVLVTSGSLAELTASAEEVRIELAQGPVPEEAVRAIPGVKAVAWQAREREMTVTFEKREADAEEMIKRVVMTLYAQNARVSGVAKGRGLEQRVIELTE